ncbi:hypothetical protein OH77DRAFT_152873 [Trametes cingulata]|nr:hypothetical protein OH77DRAFT_152873 [Trametes cingulata]
MSKRSDEPVLALHWPKPELLQPVRLGANHVPAQEHLVRNALEPHELAPEVIDDGRHHLRVRDVLVRLRGRVVMHARAVAPTLLRLESAALLEPHELLDLAAREVARLPECRCRARARAGVSDPASAARAEEVPPDGGGELRVGTDEAEVEGHAYAGPLLLEDLRLLRDEALGRVDAGAGEALRSGLLVGVGNAVERARARVPRGALGQGEGAAGGGDGLEDSTDVVLDFNEEVVDEALQVIRSVVPGSAQSLTVRSQT